MPIIFGEIKTVDLGEMKAQLPLFFERQLLAAKFVE